MIIECLLIGIGLSLLCVYSFFVWRFNYWKRRGIYTIEPKMPYGNFKNFVQGKKHFGEDLTDAYETLRREKLRFGGLFLCTRPMLILADVDLINNVFIKNFDHFADRALYRNEKVDLVTKSLTHCPWEKWVTIRPKISSFFTPKRIKSMVNCIVQYSERMCSLLDDFFKDGEPVNIKQIDFRLSLDIYNYLTFGIDANSIQNPDSQFYVYNEKFFRHGPVEGIKRLLSTVFPNTFRFFNIRVFDKDIESFYKTVVEDIKVEREWAQIDSNKFIDNLLKLTNKKIVSKPKISSVSEELTIDEVTAHALALLQGGFDGTANALTFFLYETAVQPEIQEKIRNEIFTVLSKFNNEITFECVLEMEYLHQCFQESTRKNAPTAALVRQCTKPFKIPGTDLVLPNGEMIVVSMYGIHHDPKYYPEPDKFDPERFSKENKSKIKFGTYLPFSIGPRECVGKKLAIIAIKIAVITILRKYRISLNRKTKLPLEFDRQTLGFGVNGDLWLNLDKVQQ